MYCWSEVSLIRMRWRAISTTFGSDFATGRGILPRGRGARFHGRMAGSETLLNVVRGTLVESVHKGDLVLVEGARETLVRGDPDRVVYYRSASKPLQAMEVVACGAADAFGLTAEEIALAAGSHNAEP